MRPRALADNPVVTYALTAGLVATAALLRWVLVRLVGELPPFVVFFPTVALVAVLLGPSPGMLATLLAALAADYFILPPLHALGPANLSQALALGLFVSGGLLVSLMAARVDRAGRREAAATERASAAEDLQRADNRLRDAEAQVRLQAAALEAAPHAVSLSKTDRAGTIVWVNPAFTELTGYTAEEAIGHSHHLLSSGRQGQAFYHELWETIRRGEVWHGELVNRRKDGTIYYEEMGITSLRDEAGQITHYVAIKQDITARKEAETALRESEERFRALADAVPLMVWQCAPDQNCDYFNRRWLDFTGRSFEQEQGFGWAQGVHPDDVQRCIATFTAAAVQHQPFEMEYRLRHHSGEYRWVLDDGRPRFGSDGSFMGYVGGCVDIHDRKRAEVALAESEAKYRILFENMAEEVHFWRLVRNDAGQIMTWRLMDANPAALKTWGKTLDEVKGKTTDEIFGPGAADHFMPVVQKVMTEGAVHSFEDHFAPLARTFRFTTVPLGEYFITTGADITQRKRADEALRHALVDAQRFRQAVEGVPVYVYMKDLQSRYIYANQRTLELFGCSAEELVGCDDTRFFPPETVKRLREVDARIFAGQQTSEEIDVADTGSGRRVYLEIKTPIYADPERKTICGLLGISTDITERKLAEERLEQGVRQRTVDLAKALAEAEQGRATLDALLESIPEGVTIGDAAGPKLVRASRYMAEMLGVDVKTLEGTTAAEYVKRWETFEADGVTPARPEDMPVVQAMREGRAVEGRELVMRRGTDGAKVPVLCNAAPIRDSSGHITGGVGAWRDITERKRAEAAVRESEERLRFALETSHTGAWDLDLVDHSAFRSPEHDRIFGYAELLPKWTYEMFLAHVLPEDRAAVDGNFRQATAGQTDWSFECRIRRVDGAVRWIWAAGRHRANADGQMSRMAGIVQDITERKLAEEAVRESESRLKLAQQAARIGAFEWNVQTGVNVWTPELEAMYGLAPDAFGRTEGAWEQLVHPEDRAAVLEHVEQALDTGEPAEQEWRVIWPDGRVHWIMGRFQVFKDAEGKPLRLSGVNIDITERKQAEAALRELNETLEHRVAERTEALRIAKAEAEQANATKDHFLAVLSHELRTPLTPVLPVLEELARHVAEKDREDIEMAHRNVELEARLIDDLLDVTRISRGKIELHRETVDLCTVVRRAAEVCAPDIEARRLHFGIQVEGGPHAVDADPARLQQVFWNLIKNAIKFTPHGGCVGIHCQSHDGQVVVEVKDSGMGIEPEALSRLFNAFEQVDRAVTRQFGGLGLGLAISKALVELHGGTIQAQSEGTDKGATFTVKLPIRKVAAGEVVRPKTAPATRAVAATRPLAILLVEDHGDTARIMRRMLQNRGHRVETAGDVVTALELARERPFDLLLSDLGLPDRSGLELMQELRRMGQRLPGIALSGYGQDEDVRRSRAAGFAAHLTKPVNMHQLLSTLAAVTGRGTAAPV